MQLTVNKTICISSRADTTSLEALANNDAAGLLNDNITTVPLSSP